MVKRLSDKTNLGTTSPLFVINLDKRNRLTKADDGQEIVRQDEPGDNFSFICYKP